MTNGWLVLAVMLAVGGYIFWSSIRGSGAEETEETKPAPPPVPRGMSLDYELRVLRDAIGVCGPNARAILIRQAHRLAAGARAYDDDFDDGRKWLEELIAELSDAENYADRDAIATTPSERMRVVRTLVSAAHRLTQAELRERDIPEAAE